jgi:DNA helicase II / ATP-dependent DNA helicase PcrA
MRMPNYEELSQEQDNVMSFAPTDRAILVTGPPGTGKTVLAYYRGCTLKDQNIDPRIAMYNKVLVQYTKAAYQNKELNKNVSTWHNFVYGWYRSMFGNMPPREPSDKWAFDWENIRESIIAANINQLNNGAGTWNHLILDEGQDFPVGFYNIATLFGGKLRKPVPITVFADENQRLDEAHNSTINQIREALSIDEKSVEEYRLTKNYRNTRQIAVVARHFYAGLATGTPKLPTKSGEIPRLTEYAQLNDNINFIVQFIKNNNNQTFGIFVKSRKLVKTLFNRLSGKNLGNITVQAYRSKDKVLTVKNLEMDKSNTVTIVTDKSCKGLEFDTVFIPELQKWELGEGTGAETDFKMRMYVMCARARKNLFLSYSNCNEDPAALQYLQAAINNGELNRE